MPDPRLRQLEHWLSEVFGARDFQLAPASADASFRRYFRVTRGGESWIAMDAPPQKEDMRPYIRVSAMLLDAGVNAPRILQQDLQQGFLLNTDLGSRTYLMELEAGVDADLLYGDAIAALIRIQTRAAAHARHLPVYDEVLLRREMALFPEWFCGRHLGLPLQQQDIGALRQVFDTLSAAALEQPQVFVHRDYHSRNLMAAPGVAPGVDPGVNPGILDFQDAVCGPLTYDLVSLLRDCYIEWPQRRIDDWLARFAGSARHGVAPWPASVAVYRRWFDLMGVQRHLKAIGIFARLWHRDGKRGYLKDIPRTLGYVRSVSGRYRELRFLETFIDARVLPALAAVESIDEKTPSSAT
jgi:aminoglycoside/choline kinase family phosphotransferase